MSENEKTIIAIVITCMIVFLGIIMLYNYSDNKDVTNQNHLNDIPFQGSNKTVTERIELSNIELTIEEPPCDFTQSNQAGYDYYYSGAVNGNDVNNAIVYKIMANVLPLNFSSMINSGQDQIKSNLLIWAKSKGEVEEIEGKNYIYGLTFKYTEQDYNIEQAVILTEKYVYEFMVFSKLSIPNNIYVFLDKCLKGLKSGQGDDISPDIPPFEEYVKLKNQDRANRDLWTRVGDYRPKEDIENIGNMLPNYSKYDDNIQGMSDIENIEDFRRRQRDNEIRTISINTIGGLFVIALIIGLVKLAKNTNKNKNTKDEVNK
jgi:hypothetical protein